MKLTPLDIRHKEFKRGMRGYADVEVDEFLDEVADEFERLFKDNIDLGERVEALESQVVGLQAHRGHPPEDSRLRAGQRRGAQAEQRQGGAADPARGRAQGAPARQRSLQRAAEHRAVDGQAQERRAGLSLQVPPAARGLPQAPRGSPGRRGHGAGRRHGAGRVRAPRRGHQGSHRARGGPGGGAESPIAAEEPARAAGGAAT